MKSLIQQKIEDSIQVKQQVLLQCSDAIAAVAQEVIRALLADGKIMFCGNGGSAADSQHLAAELVGRFQKDRRAMASIALTTDTSILTAIGNDYGYDEVFSRQVDALGQFGDLLVGISSSGNSQNIIKAFEAASHCGVKTVALVGRNGGKMAQISDLSIVVPSDNTARIQEAHICIGHIICELAENHFYDKERKNIRD